MVPATLEAETGGSLAPRSLYPAWATQYTDTQELFVPPESSSTQRQTFQGGAEVSPDDNPLMTGGCKSSSPCQGKPPGRDLDSRA